MKKFTNKNEAIERLRYLCSKSERCIKDIRGKLKEWNFDGNQDEIIQNLLSDDFINEQRYASAVVNDKIKFSKWGKAKVTYFLKEKGISNDIIMEALQNIIDADYEEIVTKELEKKNKSLKVTDSYQKKQKLLSFAYQRGYDIELTNKIIGILNR